MGHDLFQKFVAQIRLAMVSSNEPTRRPNIAIAKMLAYKGEPFLSHAPTS
jgi:hypothetical protein